MRRKVEAKIVGETRGRKNGEVKDFRGKKRLDEG